MTIIYDIIPRPDQRAIVARRKQTKGGYVLVPVMVHDNYAAAEHWLSGQSEVEERGQMAGYADKEDVAVMDQTEDTFNLG